MSEHIPVWSKMAQKHTIESMGTNNGIIKTLHLNTKFNLFIVKKSVSDAFTLLAAKKNKTKEYTSLENLPVDN